MSRGPGRVQRGILEALGGGDVLAVWVLALHTGASEDSTRRALRKLRRSGAVACLGYGPGGQRWGLPDAVARRRNVWGAEREVKLSHVMGARFARAFRRAVIGAL